MSASGYGVLRSRLTSSAVPSANLPPGPALTSFAGPSASGLFILRDFYLSSFFFGKHFFFHASIISKQFFKKSKVEGKWPKVKGKSGKLKEST